MSRYITDYVSQGGWYPHPAVVATVIVVGIALLYLFLRRSHGEPSAARHTPNPQLIEPGIDAADVLARMGKAYLSLSTYKDTGLVIDNAISANSRERTCAMFSTAYRRPHALAFLIQRIVNEDASTFHWFSIDGDRVVIRSSDATKDAHPLVDAISTSIQLSSGATQCVLPLLRDLPGLTRLDDLRDVVYEGTELAWGHTCFRLRGTSSTGNVVLWIDREKHLLRMAELQDGRFTIVVTAEPNAKIDDQAFAAPSLQ